MPEPFVAAASLERLYDAALLVSGAVLGWILSELTAARVRRRRRLDDFCDAVRDEIESASKLGANLLDAHAITFRNESISRLDSFAAYSEKHHPKHWRKIQPKWDAYCGIPGTIEESAPDRLGGVSLGASLDSIVQRKTIVDALNDLLNTLLKL